MYHVILHILEMTYIVRCVCNLFCDSNEMEWLLVALYQGLSLGES